MSDSFRFSLRTRCPARRAAPLVLLTSLVAFARPGASTGTYVFKASGGTQVHLEALTPEVMRIWVARRGQSRRAASLATDEAPRGRVPITIERHGGDIVADTGRLVVNFDPATLGFSIRAHGVPEPLIRSGKLALAQGSPAWTLTSALDPGERIFGLGQDNRSGGRLDRRGTVRDLWAGQQIRSGDVTAQYPIPFEIEMSRDGRAFGWFCDNVFHQTYDLGKTSPGEQRLEAAGGDIDLYVFGGPRIADVIDRYTRLTGRPSLPPLWVLGYWQSKCTYYDWRQLDEAYRQLHSRGFPVDVMVIDADWPEVRNDFQWARRWFDGGRTPRERIAWYARRGVHIVMSQSGPMIEPQSPTFATGWKMGVFATDGHGNPVECGYYGGRLLDFTSPNIDEWLWPQVRARIADGVSGWWLDLTEPEGEPPQTVYHGGTSASIHNEYSLLSTISFEGVQLAAHPDRRPWILTRAGSSGMQRHHAAVWTGDINSDYATLRAHPPEMLNSGLSGFTWWTCDTGGFLVGYYRNDPMGAHARLYERWMEFSSFSPITRAHKAGGVPEPYQFGPAVEETCRHYLKLRYRLMPYIYSCAWQASRTGLPLVRPLALEFQDDPRSRAAPGDEYCFGDDLLVAPVLDEGVTNRRVYFPPGRWFDWDTGVEYRGGRSWVVAAPQNRIPISARAGAIIPMAPAMLTTGEKPWDPITLKIYPAGRSEFTLYRDDGETFAYTRGDSTVTTIRCAETGAGVRLAIDESNRRYVPRSYVIEMCLDRRPTAVRARNAALPFVWDPSARMLTCTLQSTSGLHHRLAVELERTRLPPQPAPVLKLDVARPTGKSAGGGESTPHFFPGPAIPAAVQAANYDNGGEGVAYHLGGAAPKSATYRPDDIGIVPTSDTGGGYALAGLRTGDWVRYTIDCGGGGYFDLLVRAAGISGGARLRMVEYDRTVASVPVPATGGRFTDLHIPQVYLNPGVHPLMLYVDAPGCSIRNFALKPVLNPPSRYVAANGFRSGPCEVISAVAGGSGHDLLDKLGRKGSAVTLGIDAHAAGPAVLRLRYANHSGRTVALSVTTRADGERRFELAPTEDDAWSDYDLPVHLAGGGNKVVIAGQEDNWNAVTLDTITSP